MNASSSRRAGGRDLRSTAALDARGATRDVLRRRGRGPRSARRRPPCPSRARSGNSTSSSIRRAHHRLQHAARSRPPPSNPVAVADRRLERDEVRITSAQVDLLSRSLARNDLRRMRIIRRARIKVALYAPARAACSSSLRAETEKPPRGLQPVGTHDSVADAADHGAGAAEVHERPPRRPERPLGRPDGAPPARRGAGARARPKTRPRRAPRRGPSRDEDVSVARWTRTSPPSLLRKSVFARTPSRPTDAVKFERSWKKPSPPRALRPPARFSRTRTSLYHEHLDGAGCGGRRPGRGYWGDAGGGDLSGHRDPRQAAPADRRGRRSLEQGHARRNMPVQDADIHVTTKSRRAWCATTARC